MFNSDGGEKENQYEIRQFQDKKALTFQVIQSQNEKKDFRTPQNIKG